VANEQNPLPTFSALLMHVLPPSLALVCPSLPMREEERKSESGHRVYRTALRCGPVRRCLIAGGITRAMRLRLEECLRDFHPIAGSKFHIQRGVAAELPDIIHLNLLASKDPNSLLIGEIVEPARGINGRE
jgi:hypothetical protein